MQDAISQSEAARLAEFVVTPQQPPIQGQVYLVGGAVRDLLLTGKLSGSPDFVVVGGDEQNLLAAGFHKVGKSFPVFLHPQTKCEYALARTESKTAPGHQGFVVNTDQVSLTEDLYRRDLSINALAVDSQGVVTDPYGGLADLRAKRLRHVSEYFADDPLRIFRIIRFQSILPGFVIDNSTKKIITEMIDAQLHREISAERIYRELIRLIEQKGDLTSLLVQLNEFGILAEFFPNRIAEDEKLLINDLAALNNIQAAAERYVGLMRLRTIDQLQQQKNMLPMQREHLRIAESTIKLLNLAELLQNRDIEGLSSYFESSGALRANFVWPAAQRLCAALFSINATVLDQLNYLREQILPISPSAQLRETASGMEIKDYLSMQRLRMIKNCTKL